MENKAALLHKIKALAEKDAPGEKENSKALLEKLMKKYDISLADIEHDEVKQTYFKFKTEIERKLLSQIIYMVTGSEYVHTVANRRTKRKLKLLSVQCTAAHKIEIEAAFCFFNRAFAAELEVFFTAFFMKNNIFPDTDDEDHAAADEPSSAQEERLWKEVRMMSAMDAYTLLKALPERATR